MRKIALLFVAAVGSLAFAPAPFPKPDQNQSVLKTLQGAWVRVQNTAVGGPFPQTVDFVVEIVDDRMRYSQEGSSVLYEYAILLDARKKPNVFDAKGIGGMAKGHTYRGVFRLEGDTLTLCSRLSEAEDRRPAGFDTTQPGVLVEVFKRQKR